MNSALKTTSTERKERMRLEREARAEKRRAYYEKSKKQLKENAKENFLRKNPWFDCKAEKGTYKLEFILNSVAPSGLSRKVAIYLVVGENRVDITYDAAYMLGWTYDYKKRSLQVDGCGTDAACHTAYALSYALFGGVGNKFEYSWLN